MSENVKILVVEDNDFVRMQITSFLEDGGYEVVGASDGDDALDCLDSDIKIALVDVRMEPMGGFEFITFMQEDGYNIPVILVTGDQSPDLLSKAGQFDVATVLLKPVQKDRLLAMVGRLIDRN